MWGLGVALLLSTLDCVAAAAWGPPHHYIVSGALPSPAMAVCFHQQYRSEMIGQNDRSWFQILELYGCCAIPRQQTASRTALSVKAKARIPEGGRQRDGQQSPREPRVASGSVRRRSDSATVPLSALPCVILGPVGSPHVIDLGRVVKASDRQPSRKTTVTKRTLVFVPSVRRLGRLTLATQSLTRGKKRKRRARPRDRGQISVPCGRYAGQTRHDALV